MSGRGLESGESEMSGSNSMPPLIDFGEDEEIWGFGSSKTEQISTTPNFLQNERGSFEGLLDYNSPNSMSPANKTLSLRKPGFSNDGKSPPSTLDILSNQIQSLQQTVCSSYDGRSPHSTLDPLSNQTASIDKPAGSSSYGGVSSSPQSTLDLLSSQTQSIQKPQGYSSYGGISLSTESTLDLMSSQTPYIHKPAGSSSFGGVSSSLESSLDLLSIQTPSIHEPTGRSSYGGVSSMSPQSRLDLLSDVCSSTALLASKPESSAPLPEFGIDDTGLHQDDLFGTYSSDSLSSEYPNPFGSPPRSQSLVHDPFKTSPEPQLGSSDPFFDQSWTGIEKLSLSQEDQYPDLWNENFGNGITPVGSQGKKSLDHLDYSASQQTGSTEEYDVLPDIGDLKPNGMPRTTERSIKTGTEDYPHRQIGSNANVDFSKTSKLSGDIHQKPRKNKESGTASVPSLEEVLASGGEKGIFRVPIREAIRPGRPAFLEIRPHPLRETQDSQAICTIISTGNRLWAGLESGIRFWDIDKAYSIERESDPLLGDEDTASFVALYLQDSPTTCLVADAARNMVWSGHRDGKIRGWRVDVSSDALFSMLTWRAHPGPVLSMIVTTSGEVWTGSEAGSIRAWPWEVFEKALSSDSENHPNIVYWIEGCCIDLRSRLTAINASILSTDIRFLIYDHVNGRVWSGGSYSLVLWDARTRDVLKVFGSDAQAEFLNSDLLPGQGVSLESEMRVNYSRVSKKEKIQGTWSFLQRSKNALLGAADAVRATLGGQFLDDGRRIQAMVTSVDGTVWTGYASGLLVHWDHQGNQLQEIQNTSVGIHCLCAFRTRLWIGYADGRVQIIEENGKVLKEWLAHSSTVQQLAMGSDHVFSLAVHGGIRGWNMTILSPLESILRTKLIDMEPAYTRKEHIKILAGTWNVSQGRASIDSLRRWLSSPASEANIVVVGLQEIEMGAGVLAMAAAKETVGIEGSANGQWWLDSIGDVIDEERLFVRVGSRQLAGLLIGAWVRKDLLPYAGDVDVGAVACGFGRALGNKVAETRFASHTLVLRRLVKVREALSSMIINHLWSVWRQSNSEKAAKVKGLILDDGWWDRVDYLLSFTEPILSMLRFVDMDNPCMGEVYDGIDSMIETIKSIINAKEQDPSEKFFKEVHSILVERWNKMTTPLHLLAFALNPKYYSAEILSLPRRVLPYRDIEVSEGYKVAFSRLFPDPEEEDMVMGEFGLFMTSTGHSLGAMRDKYKKDAHMWWCLHGQAYTQLQPLAIKILSQGAVAIKMRVFRRTMCIINSHFAAHTDAVARRNADFDYIYRSMTFGRFPSGVNGAANAVAAGVSSAVQMFRGVNVRRSSQLLETGGQYVGGFSSLPPTGSTPQEVMPELAQSDMIIWLGDFNYRLNNTSYEDAIDCIEKKKITTLLEEDQLRKEMGAGRVFQGMREGQIKFSPTYKFDRGQQEYDSSEKRRVPAWCDRILFRDSRRGKSTKCKLSCPIVSSIEWYDACMDITESDHKPVMCMFNVDIAFIDEATRRDKYGSLVNTSNTAL